MWPALDGTWDSPLCDERQKVNADLGHEHGGGSFLVTGKQYSQLMEEEVWEV